MQVLIPVVASILYQPSHQLLVKVADDSVVYFLVLNTLLSYYCQSFSVDAKSLTICEHVLVIFLT